MGSKVRKAWVEACSAIYYLCDLGQVTLPLQDSFSSSVKWEEVTVLSL